MKSLFAAGRVLLLDFAATLLYLAVYGLTGKIAVAVIAGLILAVGQIGWQHARRQPVDALQWVSLVLVAASGAAAVITDDPVFVTFKPSVIYALIGAAMLKRGWMNRYLPPIALEKVPDLGIVFGYVWATLMFFTAVLNAIVALRFSPAAWAAFMSAWVLASKLSLFLAQYAVMRAVGRRRARRTVTA